jgi:hypothetical protein
MRADTFQSSVVWCLHTLKVTNNSIEFALRSLRKLPGLTVRREASRHSAPPSPLSLLTALLVCCGPAPCFFCVSSQKISAAVPTPTSFFVQQLLGEPAPFTAFGVDTATRREVESLSKTAYEEGLATFEREVTATVTANSAVPMSADGLYGPARAFGVAGVVVCGGVTAWGSATACRDETIAMCMRQLKLPTHAASLLQAVRRGGGGGVFGWSLLPLLLRRSAYRCRTRLHALLRRCTATACTGAASGRCISCWRLNSRACDPFTARTLGAHCVAADSVACAAGCLHTCCASRISLVICLRRRIRLCRLYRDLMTTVALLRANVKPPPMRAMSL